MLLTIYGLPAKIKHGEIRALLKDKCNLTDFLLDNLFSDGPNNKKVRIGVSTEEEGYKIFNALDGFLLHGRHYIKVSPVVKAQENITPQQAREREYGAQPQYPTRNDYQGNEYIGSNRPTMVEPMGGSHDWGQGGNNTWPQNPPAMVQPNVTTHYNNYPVQEQPHQPYGYGEPQYHNPALIVASVGPPFQPPEPRPNTNRNYGEKAVNNDRPQQCLRAVELVDISRMPTSAQQPQYSQEPAYVKPVTIMKDNFQGPDQPHVLGHYQSPPKEWNPQNQPQYDKTYGDNRRAPKLEKTSHSKASPNVRPLQNYEKESFPRQRPVSPSRPVMGGRNVPGHRPISPQQSRHLSPGRVGPNSSTNRMMQGRPVSPHQKLPNAGPSRLMGGRLVSPERRPVMAGRQNSPQRPRGPRNISPDTHPSFAGRLGAPPMQRPDRERSPLAPGDRRPLSSPPHKFPARHASPERKIHQRLGRPGSPPVAAARATSPGRLPMQRYPANRGESPRRMPSPPRKRFSPGPPHRSEHFEEYGQDTKVKPMRPSYENAIPGKPMYQGGFRPNVPESKFSREEELPWQKSDHRRESGRNFPRGIEAEKNVHMFERKSRSPTRRDRSPLRDRSKRHTGSPLSPRRSWALEKRRSPDNREAPPPPAWPGKDRNDSFFRPDMPDRVEEIESPAWRLQQRGNTSDLRRTERPPILEDRRFAENVHDRREIVNKERHIERFVHEDEKQPKYNPREIEERGNFHEDKEKNWFSDKQIRRDYQRRSADHEADFRDEPQRVITRSPYDIGDKIIHKQFDSKALALKNRAEALRKPKDATKREYTEEISRKEMHTKVLSSPVHGDGRDTASRVGILKRVNPRLLSNKTKTFRDKAIEEVINRLLERQKVCDDLEGEYEARVRARLKSEISRIFDQLFGISELSFIEMVVRFQAQYNLYDEAMILRQVLKNVPKPKIGKKSKSETSSDEAERSLRNTAITEDTDDHVYVCKSSSSNENSSEESQQSSQNGNTTEEAERQSDSVEPQWNLNFEDPELDSHLSPETPNQQLHQASNVISPITAKRPVPSPSVDMIYDDIETYTSEDIIAPDVCMPMPEPLPPPPVGPITAPQPIPAPSVNMIYDDKVTYGSKPTITPHVVMPIPEPLPPPPGFEVKFDEETNLNKDNSLYLSHNDFKEFDSSHTEAIKDFLISKIIEITETAEGWAPDITFKGLHQNQQYFEVQTRDLQSRSWLLNLDFSGFNMFKVLVYTNDELSFERAAIWLPGLSMSKLTPLVKLKLQNRHLKGVDISKWKLVTQVQQNNGTKLYLDIPASSAKALAKYNMTLSYELQKVNVFLRSDAVYKISFDRGMNDSSMIDKVADMSFKKLQSFPLPKLDDDMCLVKFRQENYITLPLKVAHMIKNIIVNQIFRYHQKYGQSRTDFIKYGIFKSKYFGVLPENAESRNWLLKTNIDKLKSHNIVVIDEKTNLRRISMSVTITDSVSNTIPQVMSRLKLSNKGFERLNFNLWTAAAHPKILTRSKIAVDFRIDMESLITLQRLKYSLYYRSEKNECQKILFKPRDSYGKLNAEIEKYQKQHRDKN